MAPLKDKPDPLQVKSDMPTNVVISKLAKVLLEERKKRKQKEFID